MKIRRHGPFCYSFSLQTTFLTQYPYYLCFCVILKMFHVKNLKICTYLCKTTPKSSNSHAKFEVPTVTPSTTICTFPNPVPPPPMDTMALCAKMNVSHMHETNVCLATTGKIDVALNVLKTRMTVINYKVDGNFWCRAFLQQKRFYAKFVSLYILDNLR